MTISTGSDMAIFGFEPEQTTCLEDGAAFGGPGDERDEVTAAIGLLEIVLDGTVGEVTEEQRVLLDRVAKTLASLVPDASS